MVGKEGSGKAKGLEREEAGKSKVGRPPYAERLAKDGKGALDKFVRGKERKEEESKNQPMEDATEAKETTRKKERDTEDIMEGLKALMEEVKSGKEETKRVTEEIKRRDEEMMKEMRKDREERREEIRELRRAMQQKEEERKEERNDLVERIERLEQNAKQREEREGTGSQREEELRNQLEDLKDKVERRLEDDPRREGAEEMERLRKGIELHERRERRNNITIRGIERSGEKAKEMVERLLRDKLAVRGKIEWAREAGRDGQKLIVARCSSWEDKQEIMRKKSELRGSDFFIGHDLTWEEREVQRRIRQAATAEKRKGKLVKIGYQKIGIDGEWIDWKKWEATGRDGHQNFR